MKTVGKQLQDARAAKGWSPELAARETKIRVDRLHDLEADDYSNFSSPTYARGFVRTYARALGLDEYKILRQLDNKLPEDDNASFANDTGVPYMPEPSQVSKPFEVGRGVYITAGVGAAVLLLIGFILVQSYRAGYFASTPVTTPAVPATNALPVAPESETARALPADGSAPPAPVPADNQAVAVTPAAVAPSPATSPTDTNGAPRAQPVNLDDLAAATNAAPAAPVPSAVNIPTANPAPVQPAVNAPPVPTVATILPAPAAGPVPSVPPATNMATAPAIAPVPDVAPTNAPADAAAAATPPTTVPTTVTTPPRAQPVDLGAIDSGAAPAASSPAPAPAHLAHSLSARQSNARTTVNVAAAQAATDSLIAATTTSPPPAPETAPITTEAVTGGPDPATSPTAETPSAAPASAAPSSLGPAPAIQPAPASPADAALTGTTAPDASASSSAPAPTSTGSFQGKRLVLTASHDSFVRVVALDGANPGQVRYSSMLHGGQSISFNDRKYSINVGDPSAVDIALDGINYGPHGDNSEPATFTVESHTP